MKNISRTQIVALVSSVVGLLGMVGLDAPAAALQNGLGLLTEDTFSALMVVGGAVMAGLRMITGSKVAPGVKGLLMKDTE